LEEIVTAARKAGTHILMFTEHPSERYDYVKDGHQGMRQGVLLIPGAETEGFLAFPTRSLNGVRTRGPQEFCDLVRRDRGLIFLSHLEERMTWDIHGLTGVEIYNTHADFKDEKNLIARMRNPLWLFQAQELFRRYPQEAFSALLDYPADYLKRWDVLCKQEQLTGIGANDAHQNVGIVVRTVQGDKLRLEDALGKNLLEVGLGVIPGLKDSAARARPDDVVFRLDLDPYECSLRHVGTHLLMTELNRRALWEALEAGRAFVAFDWLADATGFDYTIQFNKQTYLMGSKTTYHSGMQLVARAPLKAHWRILRDGQIVLQAEGTEIAKPLPGPGNYRVEAWLRVAGEDTIWILSNPIYVQPK
jgi:hypothetical protein